MAIDPVGAAMAASKLVGPAAANLTGMGVCLPNVTAKAAWITQVTGAYDLIYGQGLHMDFPTRLEVQKAIQQGYTMHTHNGNLGFPTGPGTGMGPLPIYQKDEIPYSKLTRMPPPPVTPSAGLPTDQDVPETPGAATVIFVRSKTPLKAIGYGL